MDGVIADFHQGVCDLFGVTLTDSKLPLPWKYAVEKNISELLGREVTPREMWTRINEKTVTEGFWLNLNTYPWARDLLHMLKEFAREYGMQIIISSNPGDFHLAFSQKIQWLKHNLDIDPSDVMLGKHKYLMASDNTFLIDDCDENTNAFAYDGGYTYLFPQPWNSAGVYSMNITQIFENLKDHLHIWETNSTFPL